jgi:hypothetical protein
LKQREAVTAMVEAIISANGEKDAAQIASAR